MLISLKLSFNDENNLTANISEFYYCFSTVVCCISHCHWLKIHCQENQNSLTVATLLLWPLSYCDHSLTVATLLLWPLSYCGHCNCAVIDGISAVICGICTQPHLNVYSPYYLYYLRRYVWFSTFLGIFIIVSLVLFLMSLLNSSLLNNTLLYYI